MQLPRLVVAGLCASLALSAQQNPAPANLGEEMPALAFDAAFNLDLPGARSLLALRGTAVLVEYWATWCAPCKAQVPHMNEVQDQFQGKGLMVVAVTGEDQALVTKYIEQNKVKHPVVIEKGQASQKQLGIQGIPHALLLDPGGRIVWRGHPASLTAADIGRALGGAHAPGAPLTGPLEPVGRLLSAQDFGKAAATLRAMLDARRLPVEFLCQAQGALTRIEGQAQALFDTADTLLGQRDHAAAVQVLDRLAGPFAGVLATDRAIAKAKELRANPTIAREILGGEQLAKARALAAAQEYGKAHELYLLIARDCPGTRVGNDAKAAAAALEKEGRLGFDPACAACKELGAACAQHKRG